MEKTTLDTMEMVMLTEEEKQYVEELENSLASGGGGYKSTCSCIS